jgi:hypothetical protein
MHKYNVPAKDKFGRDALMPISASGTFETCRWHLTKSVIKGKADFPVARYDFSL